MYTSEDARFDCEERARIVGSCGKCGREIAECMHCEECGAGKGKHHLFCSSVVQHCVKDEESGREFCLYVVQGKDLAYQLVELREFSKSENRWVQVDNYTADGADWWEQWACEVKAGEFPAPEDA